MKNSIFKVVVAAMSLCAGISAAAGVGAGETEVHFYLSSGEADLASYADVSKQFKLAAFAEEASGSTRLIFSSHEEARIFAESVIKKIGTSILSFIWAPSQEHGAGIHEPYSCSGSVALGIFVFDVLPVVIPARIYFVLKNNSSATIAMLRELADENEARYVEAVADNAGSLDFGF